ncbi:MAG: hypothetical protein HOP28_12355, partial [Gemmatimonadales bacterium]|nr:hypothetical protein [Gemmatimonadales bacterium]
MREEVTLIRPPGEGGAPGTGSSELPTDLFDQVRGRLRLLTALFAIAFGVDLFIFVATRLVTAVTDISLPEDAAANGGFQLINLSAVVASLGLRWAAGNHRISASRLHTLGMAYEIGLCFIIAILSYSLFYDSYRILPNLTWAPAVIIMFPLIMPGPPRRLLAAACAAATAVEKVAWKYPSASIWIR